jgi:hypothetical protein
MTIKQQGGIFGRNPTFNDLTAGSGSSIEGSGENITFSVNRTDASTAGALVLRAANGSLSIDSDGADKDILIRTGGSTERARFYGDSGDFSIKGNLVVDSGQGIDFSATSGTGTSELFSDYEEGTFNPTISSSSGTITSSSVTSAVYTKIGRLVTVHVDVTITDAGTGSGALNFTLPFTNGSTVAMGAGRENAATGKMLQVIVGASGAIANVFNYDNSTPIATNNVCRATVTYTT